MSNATQMKSFSFFLFQTSSKKKKSPYFLYSRINIWDLQSFKPFLLKKEFKERSFREIEYMISTQHS